MKPFTNRTVRHTTLYFFMGQSLMYGAIAGGLSLVTSTAHDPKLVEYDSVRPGLEFLRFSDWVKVSTPWEVGPSVAFMRTLAENGIVGVSVKCGYDSHGITRFIPPELRVTAPLDVGQDRYTLNLAMFNGAISRYRALGHTVSVGAFVWWQGSADGASPELKSAYGTHLERVIAYYRLNVVGASAAPWIIIRSPQGGIGSNWPVLGDARHRAQESVAEADGNAVWISPDFSLGQEAVYTDGTHPDQATTERVGRAAALKYIERFAS